MVQSTGAVRRLRPPAVVPSCIAVIALAVAWHGWLLSRRWFFFDDFGLVQHAMREDLGTFVSTVGTGQLSPGGRVLAWLAARVAPLDFVVPATLLMVLVALLGLGLLRLLVTSFGTTWASCRSWFSSVLTDPGAGDHLVGGGVGAAADADLPDRRRGGLRPLPP